LSFREGKEEKKLIKLECVPGVMSLESARYYGSLIESPKSIVHNRKTSQSHIRKKSTVSSGSLQNE
jgi:hypothetical protein